METKLDSDAKIPALEMTEENKFFRKYLKKKSGIIEQKMRRFELKKKFSFFSFKKNKDEQVELTREKLAEQDEYLFLCYMTRKYFKDNVLISLAKILIGAACILTAVFMEDHFRATALKAPLMLCLFTYGLIMIPLSVLYVFANFICFLGYANYISSRTSPLSKKIIHFYDKDTDKFMAVNLKNLFNFRAAAHERKRIRGW